MPVTRPRPGRASIAPAAGGNRGTSCRRDRSATACASSARAPAPPRPAHRRSPTRHTAAATGCGSLLEARRADVRRQRLSRAGAAGAAHGGREQGQARRDGASTSFRSSDHGIQEARERSVPAIRRAHRAIGRRRPPVRSAGALRPRRSTSRLPDEQPRANWFRARRSVRRRGLRPNGRPARTGSIRAQVDPCRLRNARLDRRHGLLDRRPLPARALGRGDRLARSTSATSRRDRSRRRHAAGRGGRARQPPPQPRPASRPRTSRRDAPCARRRASSSASRRVGRLRLGDLQPLDLLPGQLLDIVDILGIVGGHEACRRCPSRPRGRCGRCGGRNRRDATARRS